MSWILFKDKKPENNQHIYYYFDILGVFEGYYKEYYDNELEAPVEIFYGKHGFLGGGEVTHWMPYTDELPKPPM